MDSLPDELVVKILALLDIKALVAAQKACKFFHNLVSTAPQLLYHKELAATRRLDQYPVSTPYDLRLSRLKQSEEAWRSLRLPKPVTIPNLPLVSTNGYSRSLAQISSGYFVRLCYDAYETRAPAALTWARLPTYDSPQYTAEGPHVLSDNDQGHILLTPDTHHFHAWAVDATSDLVVYVSREFAPHDRQQYDRTFPRLHIARLFSESPHPLSSYIEAIEPRYFPQTLEDDIDCGLAISDTYIALLTRVMHSDRGTVAFSSLLLINRPDETHTIIFLDTSERLSPDICFLSQTMLCTISIQPTGSIQIFHLSDTPQNYVNGSAIEIERTTRFLLPPLRPTARFLAITMDHRKRNFVFPQESISVSDPLPPVVNPLDPSTGIMALRLTAQTSKTELWSDERMIIDKMTLVRLSSSSAGSAKSDAPLITEIGWNSWGPRATRTFVNSGEVECDICGSRYLVERTSYSLGYWTWGDGSDDEEEDPEDKPLQVLRVYNFDPDPRFPRHESVQVPLAAESQSESESTSEDNEGMVDDDSIFPYYEENLPFRSLPFFRQKRVVESEHPPRTWDSLLLGDAHIMAKTELYQTPEVYLM